MICVSKEENYCYFTCMHYSKLEATCAHMKKAFPESKTLCKVDRVMSCGPEPPCIKILLLPLPFPMDIGIYSKEKNS